MGTTIDFRITNDIKVDGNVVIPSGAMAKGQVVRVQKAKGLGAAGYVAVEMKSVEAIDGTRASLAGGDLYQEGEDKQTLALVLGILVCILFLTIKGKNAVIPKGYNISPAVAISADINV